MSETERVSSDCQMMTWSGPETLISQRLMVVALWAAVAAERDMCAGSTEVPFVWLALLLTGVTVTVTHGLDMLGWFIISSSTPISHWRKD